MPVGPSILWPLQARKSAPRVGHVERDVGHRLGAVDHHHRPHGVGGAASSATGGMVPVTLDMALTATIRVRSSITDSAAAVSSW